MGVLYANRSDVFGVGVPRGALTRPARLIKSVDASADVLELEGHGLADGDSVEFTVSGSGVLPAPLLVLTVYYAKLITLADGSTDENRFQVAASPGGAAIDLTSVGTQPFSAAIPTGPMIDRFLEKYSRWVDSVIVGVAVPLVAPFPVWVTTIVALRAAIAVANALGRSTPSLQDRERTEIADFLRLAQGAPLRGDALPQVSANTAVVTSSSAIASSTGVVPRGTIP